MNEPKPGQWARVKARADNQIEIAGIYDEEPTDIARPTQTWKGKILHVRGDTAFVKIGHVTLAAKWKDDDGDSEPTDPR